MMEIRNHLVFDLWLGPYEESELAVTRVSGLEALSEPYAFEVEFVPVSGEELELESLLAAKAKLRLSRVLGGEQWVNGICASLDHLGVYGGKPRYRAVLAPRLVLLGQTSDIRVFQDRTAPEIVKAVLDEGKVAYRSKLRGTYPERDLCVQYKESHLAFVTRLLEEEGICYWFEQSEDGHVMVLGDEPKAFVALPGGEQVAYRVDPDERAQEEEYLSELREVRQYQPERVTLRDYDFERPSADVTEGAGKGNGEEIYEYPGGRTENRELKRLSQVRLEEQSLGGELWRAAGACERIRPGYVFEVSGHPEPSFDQRLLAVRVVHQGRQQSSAGDAGEVKRSYRNRVVAIREGTSYRPRRRTARPKITGFVTGVVVGAGPEEVWVDQHGRVLVQFHWDRKRKANERSTAWVRVAQSWAGPGFGSLFVPRVGQEVMVRFLDGNPDRPLVRGAIYNGENRPPIELPLDKSRSTLKSDSSLGGGGWNELRFEDAKGMEEVYLHGQRDEKVEVENDKAQEVKGNEALEVGKDRSRAVVGEQDLLVMGDDTARVGGNQALEVAGDRSTRVGGSQTETVTGSETVLVGGDRTLTVRTASTETVGGAAALTIGGAYAVNVAGAYNQAVGGAKTVEIGGALTEFVGLKREETVGGDKSAEVGGEEVIDVEGAVASAVEGDCTEEIGGGAQVEVAKEIGWAAKSCQIEVEEFRLTMKGKLVLSFDKSGQVKFHGRNLTVNGQTVNLKGGKLSKVGPAAQQQKDLKVKELEALRSARAVAEFSVVDQEGNPVVNEPFMVKLPDGTTKRGVTDGTGHGRVPVPKDGSYQLTLPRLDAALWGKKGSKSGGSPGQQQTSGPTKTHRVRQGECVASIARHYGVTWETIWSHPKNAELRKKRKNPDVLLDGDEVFVPARQIKSIKLRTGEKLELESKLAPTPIRMRLTSEGNPRAGLPYVIELSTGGRLEGKTNSDGWIEATIPGQARGGTVRIETKLGTEVHALGLGQVDPVAEPRGVQQRLNNLGYAFAATEELDESTRQVLAQFQQQHGLEMTGEADEPTRQKLVEIHGS